MSTGNLSMGFYVDRLENKFKQLHKSKYTIACNSGGGALEIIFELRFSGTRGTCSD